VARHAPGPNFPGSVIPGSVFPGFGHTRVSRSVPGFGACLIVAVGPLYSPSMWSAFDNMEFAFPRTHNKVEA
jgi:hypothetical protein